MLTLLSPAKRLDAQTPPLTENHSIPAFQSETETLVAQARKLSEAQLKKLMGISDDLARLNAERFRDFEPTYSLGKAKQAIHLFQGDVYQGLDASSLDEGSLQFAQDHLRILSGLYGLLRPLDLIHPYRLEMGSRFRVGRARNLYQFWGNKLTEAVNEAASDRPAIINLASNEYFSAIKTKGLARPLITPQFREERDGQLKMISFFAKKARGQMARYIVDGRLTDPEAVKKFDRDGYRFRADLSTDGVWVFARPDSRKK